MLNLFLPRECDLFDQDKAIDYFCRGLEAAANKMDEHARECNEAPGGHYHYLAEVIRKINPHTGY